MNFHITLTGKFSDGKIAGSWQTTDSKKSGTFEAKLDESSIKGPTLKSTLPKGTYKFVLWDAEEDPAFSELNKASICFEVPNGRGEAAESNIRGFFVNAGSHNQIVGTCRPNLEVREVQMTILRNVPDDDFSNCKAAFDAAVKRVETRANLVAYLQKKNEAAQRKKEADAAAKQRRQVGSSAALSSGTFAGDVLKHKVQSTQPEKSKEPRSADSPAPADAGESASTAAAPLKKRSRKIKRVGVKRRVSRMLKHNQFIGVQTSHPVVLLLGPPGVGKGTQGQLLQQYLGFRHVSCGEMYRQLRAEGTETDCRLGYDVQTKLDRLSKQESDDAQQSRRMNEYTVRSQAIDACLTATLKQAMADRACFGFVIDGCRNREQAERIRDVLKSLKLSLTLVVPLAVSELVARRRLAGRLVHAASGRVYSSSELEDGNQVDELTGEKLQRRKEDDDEAIIKTRFETYHKRLEPLLNYLRSIPSIVTATELVTTGLAVGDVYSRLAALVLRETRLRCSRTNLNFVRPAFPKSPLPPAPGGVRGAAVVLIGALKTLDSIAHHHFLPNEEVSGLVPWPLSKTPSKLLAAVSSDERWSHIDGMDSLGMEGLLREAICCPAHAGIIRELDPRYDGYSGGVIDIDTSTPLQGQSDTTSSVRFATDEMNIDQVGRLRIGRAVTFHVLRRRARDGSGSFKLCAVALVVHSDIESAREAVTEKPASKSIFHQTPRKSENDLGLLLCLEGLSEKAKSKGYTSADLTIPGGGLEVKRDAQCSLRCALRELVEETGITLDSSLISEATQKAFRNEAGLGQLPLYRDTVSKPSMRVYFIMLPPQSNDALLCPALYARSEQTFKAEHRLRPDRDDRPCSLVRIHDMRRPQFKSDPDPSQTNWIAAYGAKEKCIVFTHGLTGERVRSALQKPLVDAGWSLEMTMDGRRLYWLNKQSGMQQARTGKYLEAPPGFVVGE